MGERVEVRGRQRNQKGRRERKEQGTKREGVVWVHNRKSGRGGSFNRTLQALFFLTAELQ